MLAAPWHLWRVPGVFFVLAVLMLLFGILAPGFFSAANVTNVLSQSSILLLLAIPMTFIIMTEGLDLSVGAIVTVASMAFAMAAVRTGSVGLASLAAVCIGLLFGLINGFLIAVARLAPFVATLGTLGVGQGVALLVTDGQPVTGLPRATAQLYSGSLGAIPIPVLVGVTLFVAAWIVLRRTRIGVHVVALGGNRDALAWAGVKGTRLLAGVYAIGGALAGVAAILLSARMNAGQPTVGLGMEFEAIAAVAVGGTSFSAGKGTIVGTLVAVVSLGVLRNGLNLLGVNSSLQVAAVGILVLAALLIERGQDRTT